MKEYRQTRFARPPGATELLLVRHGESRPATPGESFPLVDGQGDPELAAVGREQAERVGERLRNLPIAGIYVTNLVRTVETAAPLAVQLGVEPVVVPDLREVHLGEWEGGLLRVHAHENHPLYLKMQTEERWDVIPGAEAHAVIDERVQRGLRFIADRHPDQLVAAVVHGGIIGHILAAATGSRPFAFHGADNGSISQVVLQGDRVIVRRFNDTTHLEDLLGAGSSQLT